MFDQVLLRPDVLPMFQNNTLKIIDRVGELPLLNDNGIPDKTFPTICLYCSNSLVNILETNMTDSNDDLWPDLTGDPEVKSPLLILREQAAKLGTKTSNIIEAEVTANPGDDGFLHVRLILKAPALNGYEYVLLSVNQSIESYPAYLTEEYDHKKVNNEQEFKTFLGNLFKSDRTVKIINSLIAQSKHAA